MQATNTFTVSDFSKLHTTTRETYSDAVIVARRYSANGSGECPSTIRDTHGCRWTVYAVGEIECVSCPAVSAGRSAYCECDSDSAIRTF